MTTRAQVLGVRVDAGNLESAAAKIIGLAQAGERGYICVANVHMVVTAKQDEALKDIMQAASMVTSDGMPLVWLLRRSGLDARRVAGPDLLNALFEPAARQGIPVYFFGSNQQVLSGIREVLHSRHPDLRIGGMESPAQLGDRPSFDAAAAGRIGASGARIVFVGLGCPKQEFWMAQHAEAVPAIMIGVGAAFDFIAGTKRRAPPWMQRHGLEWLFRLASEPKRLWRRYFLTNSLFLLMLGRDLFRRNPP
jgi:N-acetylglucosaminyldiphosphoundecaprenol N-acetyl-beta-D-mannosaminyltransferase